MRITVFGATGRTGRHVLSQGMRRGHEITAFARRPEALAGTGGLAAVVPGDARDVAAVGKALAECDAVICTVAGSGRKDPHRLADVARAITEAMIEHDVRRLVITSAYGMVAEKPRLGLAVVRRLLATAFADGRAMERLVAARELDWTIARLPQLRNGSASGRFRTSTELFTSGPYALARADAATALLDLVADATSARAAVNVAAAQSPS